MLNYFLPLCWSYTQYISSCLICHCLSQRRCILGKYIWRRVPQFILICPLSTDNLKNIIVRLFVHSSGHIADIYYSTLCSLVLSIILSLCFYIYTIHVNNVTSLQSWPEKGGKGKYSSRCLLWQDLKWVEERTSTSHAEIREASLWDNKRSFHKHQWTEGTFKQAHQNTHQRDIYPPLLTITKVSDSWFCWICTVRAKGIEEKKALSSKASEIEFRERMELFPNISAMCREMKKH